MAQLLLRSLGLSCKKGKMLLAPLPLENLCVFWDCKGLPGNCQSSAGGPSSSVSCLFWLPRMTGGRSWVSFWIINVNASHVVIWEIKLLWVPFHRREANSRRLELWKTTWGTKSVFVTADWEPGLEEGLYSEKNLLRISFFPLPAAPQQPFSGCKAASRS